MTDHEAEARARLATKEGRIEAITQRAYSRRFGSGNSNYIRECADDEYELLGFLAAAEQRAAEAEAALATLLGHLPSDEVLSESWQGDMYWEDIFALAEIVPIYRAALTAPATQPDERAAAERNVTQRVRELLPYLPDTADPYAYQEESEGVYIIRWRITREGAGAIDNVIDAMQSLDATDGAAKEGA